MARLTGHFKSGPAEKIPDNIIGKDKPTTLIAKQKPCLHGIEQFLDFQVWQGYAGFPHNNHDP
jgi:hypothetical protein